MNLPESFTNRIKTQLGDEYEAYMNCLDQGMHHGLRVNTNKISVEDFLKISPFELKPVPWTTNGFYYDDKACTPSKHPYYYAGLYYIQEPSAMAPASILPVEDGDVVLDICAAPGGKSTELAAKLHGTGFLISNDISNSRAKALLKNLELFGIGNMCVVSEAPNKLSTKFYHLAHVKILCELSFLITIRAVFIVQTSIRVCSFICISERHTATLAKLLSHKTFC
jgi:16S rRNA C967 or C1407 C5-methylase (RsmB/RsmF family)